MLVNRLLFATLLSNVVTTVFIAARRESVRQIVLMVPLLFLVGGFKWYCQLSFESGIGLGLKGMEKGKARVHPSNDSINVRFGHPALYKELMTPMVAEHAKDLVGE